MQAGLPAIPDARRRDTRRRYSDTRCGRRVGHSRAVALSSNPTARERLSSARRNARFKSGSFDALDLSVVQLDQLWLDRCTFRWTDLRHATLDRCFFKFCDFSQANLRAASLRFARFAASDLRGADLRDCDLTGAEFGPVNTGSDNAFTDLSDVLWTDDGLVRATLDRVVGAPD